MNNGQGDDIETVVKLVQLNSFHNAQAMLDRLEVAEVDDEIKAKVAYYRGRLLEENGEKSKAIETYQEMILEYYRYEIAKNANRRILVMAANHSNRAEINALAVENNKLLKDEGFDNILELNESIGTTNAIPDSQGSEFAKDVIDDDFLEKFRQKSKEKREIVEMEAVKTLQEEQEAVEKEKALELQRQEKIKKQKQLEEQRKLKKRELERKRTEDLRLKKEREKQKAIEKSKALERAKAMEEEKAQMQKKKVEDNGDYSIEYYRKDGQLSQVDQFNKAGKKTGYLKYVYDENGNRIRIDTYDENDQLVEYY